MLMHMIVQQIDTRICAGQPNVKFSDHCVLLTFHNVRVCVIAPVHQTGSEIQVVLQAVGSSCEAAQSAFRFAQESAVITRLVRFLNDCSSSSQSKYNSDHKPNVLSHWDTVILSSHSASMSMLMHSITISMPDSSWSLSA